jgi:cellulose synthase/poly-beta-1,6-N-acetylglucosamine synthase-like glycosyltransferase
VLVDALLFTLVASSTSFLYLIAAKHPSELPRFGSWLSRAIPLVLLVSGGFWLFTRDAAEAAAFGCFYFGVCLIFRQRFPDWDLRGHSFFSAFAAGLVVFLVVDVQRIAVGGLSPVGWGLSLVLLTLEIASATLSIYYAFEVLNVMTRVVWRRAFKPVTFATGYYPKVSIQVPAHAEPVDMVLQTLEALARIDYPNYEVMMIDDNTVDASLWEPVMDFCREKGFKVFHLQDYPGFKSGALNFALTQTASDAEIIAVVDSDYIVAPEYLRECVPHFQNPAVAFVQTPQFFRNLEGFPFRQSGALAQRFFFEIGMPSRNERNSIIFCGTMGLIRKSVLKQIGGWSEWCITEDAEASLRILQLGYESVYINRVYGQGLTPETFEDTKKQRYRWAFGGIQILRRYWRWLVPGSVWSQGRHLTLAQRVDYLMGFLGWFNDLLILAFTGYVLTTALSYSMGFELPVRRLLGLALVVPVLAIITGVLRVGWALRRRTGCSWRAGVGAFISMLSLSWTIAQACGSGLVHSRGVFLRTPKDSNAGDLARRLRVSLAEGILGVTLVVAVVTLLNVLWSFESVLLAILLLWHAVVYLSALRSSLTDSEQVT